MTINRPVEEKPPPEAGSGWVAISLLWLGRGGDSETVEDNKQQNRSNTQLQSDSDNPRRKVPTEGDRDGEAQV